MMFVHVYSFLFFFFSFLCALEQFKCVWDYLIFEGLIEFPCEILIVNSIAEFEGEIFHYGKCKDFFKNFYVGLYVLYYKYKQEANQEFI